LVIGHWSLVIAALSALYNPQHWRYYPSMSEIRCISTSSRHLFVAVPAGVYIFDRSSYRHLRTLTAADGIEGDVQLCAFNPGRNRLLITTDQRLYDYIIPIGSLHRLDPPFQHVQSIGVSTAGVYFDTEAGLFQKHPVTDVFTKVQSVPDNLTWFGERDTIKPRNFPLLTPYFVRDEWLTNRPMTLVRPDRGAKKLYVAVQDYGLFVYGSSGFPDYHLRYGPPPDAVRRIVEFDNRIWFISSTQTVAVDKNGTWSYYATGPGDLTAGSSFSLRTKLLDLDRREQVAVLLPVSKNIFLGTNYGLHLLDPRGRLTLVATTNRRITGLTWLRDSLLVGTDQGLFLLVGDTLTPIHDPFGRTDWGVFDITRNRAGTAFFGTLGGVLELDSAGTWTHLVPPGFDLSQPVRALAAATDFLFLGSAAGLTVYHLKDGSWTTINPTNGLSATAITALYADDRYLWIATPEMVSRFDYRAALH